MNYSNKLLSAEKSQLCWVSFYPIHPAINIVSNPAPVRVSMMPFPKHQCKRSLWDFISESIISRYTHCSRDASAQAMSISVRFWFLSSSSIPTTPSGSRGVYLSHNYPPIPLPSSQVLIQSKPKMDSLFNSGAHRAARRATIIAAHLIPPELAAASLLSASNCLHYNAPELTNPASFNPIHLRRILDGHHVEARDWLFKLMEESPLFCPKRRCEGKVFVAPDYNATKEQQREMTMRRIEFLLNNGVFEGWLTDPSTEATMREFALMETLGVYDHSLAIKIGVHFMLWYHFLLIEPGSTWDLSVQNYAKPFDGMSVFDGWQGFGYKILWHKDSPREMVGWHWKVQSPGLFCNDWIRPWK